MRCAMDGQAGLRESFGRGKEQGGRIAAVETRGGFVVNRLHAQLHPDGLDARGAGENFHHRRAQTVRPRGDRDDRDVVAAAASSSADSSLAGTA